jgi:hypothetical protein
MANAGVGICPAERGMGGQWLGPKGMGRAQGRGPGSNPGILCHLLDDITVNGEATARPPVADWKGWIARPDFVCHNRDRAR